MRPAVVAAFRSFELVVDRRIFHALDQDPMKDSRSGFVYGYGDRAEVVGQVRGASSEGDGEAAILLLRLSQVLTYRVGAHANGRDSLAQLFL